MITKTFPRNIFTLTPKWHTYVFINRWRWNFSQKQFCKKKPRTVIDIALLDRINLLWRHYRVHESEK